MLNKDLRSFIKVLKKLYKILEAVHRNCIIFYQKKRRSKENTDVDYIQDLLTRVFIATKVSLNKEQIYVFSLKDVQIDIEPLRNSLLKGIYKNFKHTDISD